MDNNILEFTSRQVMNSPDFEFFHYSDKHSLNVEYHNHDFYEIFFFISGRVKYIIEGKTYNLRPNDILLTNNRELHKPVIENGINYERIVIWVDPSFVKKIENNETFLTLCFEDSSKHHYNLLRPNIDLLHLIKKIYEKFEKSYNGNDYGDTLLRKIYMTELLIYLNKAYFDTSKEIEIDIEQNSKISNVVHYINENLCEDLSLDTLSQKFYISKYHLSRQFKQYVGFTIHQYISKKRLIFAKIHLYNGASIDSAYIGSGFNNYQNFLKAFKDEFGFSPKKYVKSLSKNKI
ncbi:AraC family transcriptional regulator [Clostridium paridis]|uniref:Helix-turn-helix domain-containing protein n=1 Tax=Clostridium paridis TaxID=2803863 RepID=A0A937FIJ3_9CLOT|nr:AraC family transcriptional regulator [Clostridium paridis]MBL4932767.1 helix-turn-helix domain-containing protein [Clostridium paridis]